jgi:O-antigen/teichoic acid export membrane protein
MGIIKRQGIKNSIVNYTGVVIGAFSWIFIYPLIPKAELGVVQFVIRTCVFLSPIALLGLNLTIIQYFPAFKDEKRKHNGFLTFTLTWAVVSLLGSVVLLLLFKGVIARYFGEQSVVFIDYLPYILPLLCLMAFAYLFTSYAANFNRIVVPSIFYNLLLKISLPVLVFLYWKGLISYKFIFDGVVGTYLVAVTGLVWYIWHLGEFKLSRWVVFPKGGSLRSILNYSSFNVLLSLSTSLSSQIDAILIGPLTKDFGNVAVFSIGAFIAEAIDVPRKALSSISAPLLSESLKNGNIGHVEEIYKKSALTQLIAGALLLSGVWVCIDYLFQIMPNGDKYVEGKYIILLLGVSRLIDMATGVNSEILTYSKYYRFNFPSMIGLAVFTVVGNLLIIPKYGIIGSACVTLIGMFVYNVVKLVFIYRKLGVQPLQPAMALVAVIGVVSAFIPTLIPSFASPYVNIMLRGTAVVVVFIGLVLLLHVSKELNDLAEQFLKKVQTKNRS